MILFNTFPSGYFYFSEYMFRFEQDPTTKVDGHEKREHRLDDVVEGSDGLPWKLISQSPDGSWTGFRVEKDGTARGIRISRQGQSEGAELLARLSKVLPYN